MVAERLEYPNQKHLNSMKKKLHVHEQPVIYIYKLLVNFNDLMTFSCRTLQGVLDLRCYPAQNYY